MNQIDIVSDLCQFADDLVLFVSSGCVTQNCEVLENYMTWTKPTLISLIVVCELICAMPRIFVIDNGLLRMRGQYQRLAMESRKSQAKSILAYMLINPCHGQEGQSCLSCGTQFILYIVS